ncbi:MAG TPA: TolC family protein [Acidobacteriota bacterium]|nr:TolC family protein [Acidobacteriota bacterium]
MRKISVAFIFIFLAFVLKVYPEEKNTFSLQELIDIGVKSNPEIMAKKMKTKSLYEAYLASKRLSNPEFEYTTGDAESYDGDIQRITQNLSVQQSLENPFKRHFRLQVNKKTWEASELNYEYLKLEITSEIKEIFFKILFLKKKLELSNKKKNSIEKIYQLIKKRADLGEVKDLEALKLSVEMLKAQNDLNEVKTELKLSKARLNTLLGNSLPQDFKVKGELRYVPLIFSEESILEEKLSNHPLMKEKQALVEQAWDNINYVRWQRFPDFNLAAFSQKMLEGTNQGIGISLDIPLWNQKSREVLEAENLALSQSRELQALRMELFSQVQTKLNRLDLSEHTIRLFEQALLRQAQESMRISELSYHHGEISLIEFLDTQRTYFSILKDYQESLLRWNLDKAALEKVMGEELK